MISWSFIKNQVALVYWDYRKFLDDKIDTMDESGDTGFILTKANHDELKDMFAFEYSGPVIELGILKAIQKSESKFAIIQAPGSVIAREFTIRAINYMEKNTECSVLATHIHKVDTEGDRWWGLMPYVIVVNLVHFKEAGRLFFGNRRDGPDAGQLFPEIVDNDGILTSTGTDIPPPSNKLFYGWNWICKFLQKGYEIHKFDNRINPFRQFVYYESEKDLKKHNWLLENMTDYIEDGELDI